MTSRFFLLIFTSLTLFGCEDDIAIAPIVVHEIEGENQLCILPEAVDTSVWHPQTFEPHNPTTSDTLWAYKGKSVWQASGTFWRTDSTWSISARADWGSLDFVDGTYDRIWFFISKNTQAPGCYSLFDYDADSGETITVKYVIDEYDVRVARPRLDPTADNYFEILPTTAETEERFRARFAATFLVDVDDSTPPYIYPTERFTQGYVDMAR